MKHPELLPLGILLLIATIALYRTPASVFSWKCKSTCHPTLKGLLTLLCLLLCLGSFATVFLGKPNTSTPKPPSFPTPLLTLQTFEKLQNDLEILKTENSRLEEIIKNLRQTTATLPSVPLSATEDINSEEPTGDPNPSSSETPKMPPPSPMT